jgi:hypothetical protein
MFQVTYGGDLEVSGHEALVARSEILSWQLSRRSGKRTTKIIKYMSSVQAKTKRVGQYLWSKLLKL